MDGQSVALSMSKAEKEKFLAICPDGVDKLMLGVSFFLLRIFVEAKDKESLYQIRAAIAKGKKLLDGQKQLPDAL